MYKIRRVNIPDVFSFCRCYASKRNQPNHYETLSVQSDSTQKEIRDAFLKLSKEFHPDIGGKGSHAEFVKVNEAYKILSKDYTRQQHDMDLKCQASRNRNEGYYHDPVDFKSPVNPVDTDYGKNYHGNNGSSRISKWKIVTICVLAVTIIISIELSLLRSSVQRSQKYLNRRNLEAELHYAEVKAAANSMSREERIQVMQKKFDADSGQKNLGEN